MITFLICLAALITAYFTYGKYLSKVADIDSSRPTPCHTMADGLDYIRLPQWKVFLIQLLNIAGTGPIFGAILGACFGPVAFLWITLGGIFFGAMHDFFSGVMIMRDQGKSIPEVLGLYLGKNTKHIMRLFSIVVLILVGTVFILSPAQLLSTLVPTVSTNWWLWIILIYYLVATLLPIDKIIGKLYPIFGIALLAMAIGLLGALIFSDLQVPEMSTFHNFQLHPEQLPIIPTLFVTIACGAISGFHATQSPLMARCIDNERQSRAVFYGSMISESVIALIWAAAAMAFFGGCTPLGEALAANDNNPSWAVNQISFGTLGIVGGVLAVLGVVIAPITSGDTAFRSARLVIADIFSVNQRPILKRLAVCLPLFAVGYFLSQINFSIIWRYFAWANQALACVVLWSICVWLWRRHRCVWLAFIPAMAMTYIEVCFVLQSGQFVGLSNLALAYTLAGIITAAISVMAWLHWHRVSPDISKLPECER